MLNIIRLRFLRGEEVKYISHLDMMKVFERAQRRANIPLAYSQGFNPHPSMIFGLPLSVGVTSESEYADFEFTMHLDPSEFIERLNKTLPKGFVITKAKARQSKANIMASISAASYDILISTKEKMTAGAITKNIKEFIKRESIIVTKEGKNGSKDVDIRKMIFSITPKSIKSKDNKNDFVVKYLDKLKNPEILPPTFSIENLFYLSVCLSAGSVANLKAELFVSGLRQAFDNDIKLVKIHRTGLFVNDGNSFIDPLDEKGL